MRKKKANKALYRSAITLRSITSSELGRCLVKMTTGIGSETSNLGRAVGS